MIYRDIVENEYFEWMFSLVSDGNQPKDISYRKLLMNLQRTPFRYSIPKDDNRAEDGIGLRYRFACDYPNLEDAELYLDGPCSVFEMMLALAIRCEETIMDDPKVGNRTKQWFWGMVTNLGLGSMTDDRFDRRFVDDVVERFLDRRYEPDGTGGLFTVRNCRYDLRKVEIWYQLCWYLDSCFV